MRNSTAPSCRPRRTTLRETCTRDTALSVSARMATRRCSCSVMKEEARCQVIAQSTRTIITKRIVNCLSSACDLDGADVTPDTLQSDVEGWDAIGMIRLILCLEEEFGVSISP